MEHSARKLMAMASALAHVVVATGVGAQPSPLGRTQPVAPKYSLVSQGGISMGAWQAGFGYYIAEWRRNVEIKRSRAENAPFEHGFAAVTGASAGAVNGLITALAGCQMKFVEPRSSLYYQIWVDSLALFGRNGEPGLFPSSDTENDPLAIFDARAITDVAMERAREAIADKSRYVPGCAVDVGLTVTHAAQAVHAVHVGAQGHTLLERSSLRKRFVLRVTPKETTEFAVNIRPAGNGDARAQQKYRPYYANLGEARTASSESVMALVRASGAFPLAFPQVTLPYVAYGVRPGSARRDSARFVDGGTFNNTPVNLAIDLNAWRGAPGEMRYLFLEPNVTRWQVDAATPGKSGAAPAPPSLATALTDFASGFVSSSKDAEFFDIARDHAFLRGPGAQVRPLPPGSPSLQIPVRQMPIMGEQLGAFFGFLERDFRMYDFYVGMADARAFLSSQPWGQWTPCAPEQQALDELDAALRARDPHYHFMARHYEREPSLSYVAPGIDLSSACPGKEEGQRERCERSAGNYSTLVAAMHDYRRWLLQHGSASPAEKDNAFFRALAGEQAQKMTHLAGCIATAPLDTARGAFKYDDLPARYRGESRELTACELAGVVRLLAHDAADHLADSNDGFLGLALKIAHRPALDAMTGITLWPRLTTGLGIGQGVEGYFGLRIAHGWRLDTGLRPLRLSPGFRPKNVDQSRFASDAYLRVLWQRAVALSVVEFDPFVTGSLGTSPGDGWGGFGGIGAGIRATLVRRLSVGVEGRHLWAAKHQRSTWFEGNLFVGWQFLH